MSKDTRGGVLDKIKNIKIPYQAHPWQKIVHNDRSRFRVIPAGRKFGKTTLCIREAFDYLGAKNNMVWWCAPYQQVANLGYRRFIQIVPGILIASVNKKDHQVNMINGSTIQFKSTENEGGLVGEGLDLLIMDEASRVKEKTWQETIRPNLDDPMRKGNCIMISTPQGYNWFYEAWMLGQQKRHGYTSWAMDYKNEEGGIPSWKNPYFTRENLLQAHQVAPKIFLQEYGARFLRDLGAVFRNIRGAIREMAKIETEGQELEGVEYVAGVDWGRANDYTVVTILDVETGQLVDYDRFRKTSWNLQVKRVAELLRTYKARALCDGTGLGDPVYDMLYKEYSKIRNFNITNSRKQEIIDNLAIMIERGGKDYKKMPLEDQLVINGPTVTYPEIPELIQELSMFGMDVTPGGRIKYTAPRGFHDDFVISLALAAWQLKRSSVDLGFEFSMIF